MGGHFQGAFHLDKTLLSTLGREDGLLKDARGLLEPKNVLQYERRHSPLGLSAFLCSACTT